MKYKIIVGPTQMRVERYELQSEPIDIDDRHIAADDLVAAIAYDADLHPACQRYMQLMWYVRGIEWKQLRELLTDIVDKYPTMHFDGPSWIVSTVPWKQAKYGEWFVVSNKLRWLLRGEYTNGVRNRQEETSGVPSV